MKRKQATLLTLVGVSALSLLAMFVGTHGRQLIPSFAEPKNYDRSLGPTEFEKDCVFENYAFDGKTDSKAFTYQMEDGKYMEGAILYGDCQHQSVGANLSQPFILDNSVQGGANNADFHIFFSAKGITHAEFHYDIKLDQAPAPEKQIHVQSSVKSSTHFSSGLYNGLSGKAYSNITEGSAAFYDAGSGSGNRYLTSTNSELKDVSYAISDIESANAVAFQVNVFGVPAGSTLTITLQSGRIKYTC